jgi:hypothetical protein
MDDKDKSIFDTVTDSIKNTINIATEAAKHAIEPEPLKPDEEVVLIPPVGAPDLVNPMPPMYAVVKKKRRASKRVAKAAKTSKSKTAKKSPAKAAKKSKAKKSAKKAMPKKKKSKAKAAPKKTAKKVVKKKKSKKSKR